MTRWVEVQNQDGAPVTVGEITITPQSQALIVRFPFAGGFVWHRPTGVLVERAGQAQTIPVIDVTRIVQIALVACALLFGLAAGMGVRRRGTG